MILVYYKPLGIRTMAKKMVDGMYRLLSGEYVPPSAIEFV